MPIAFYLAAGVAVLATFRVVSGTNPVHALLYLVISLIAVAMCFFCLGAPLAGALEIIVYAGAIMVLFVFVVMMLNLGAEVVQQEKKWLRPQIWIGPSLLALLLLAELLYVLFISGQNTAIGQSRRYQFVWLLCANRGALCHVAFGRIGCRFSSRPPRSQGVINMQAVSLEHALMLSAILFCLGLCGLLMRRNILFINDERRRARLCRCWQSLGGCGWSGDVYFDINPGRCRSVHWSCPITATVPPFSYARY